MSKFTKEEYIALMRKDLETIISVPASIICLDMVTECQVSLDLIGTTEIGKKFVETNLNIINRFSETIDIDISTARTLANFVEKTNEEQQAINSFIVLLRQSL